MSKKLPAILIIGGVVIGAIALFGFRSVNKPSDAELLNQAILDAQAAQRATAARLDEQRKQVLTPPAECESITTRMFFDICETEPYPGQTPPPWNQGLSEAEQKCMLETLHATNDHAFALQQQEYGREPPSDMGVIYFACDVAAATLHADGIGYGDLDASAPELLAAFHRDRASTYYGPERSY